MISTKDLHEIAWIKEKGSLIQCGENWDLFVCGFDFHLLDTENNVIYTKLSTDKLLEFVPDTFVEMIEDMKQELVVMTK